MLRHDNAFDLVRHGNAFDLVRGLPAYDSVDAALRPYPAATSELCELAIAESGIANFAMIYHLLEHFATIESNSLLIFHCDFLSRFSACNFLHRFRSLLL